MMVGRIPFEIEMPKFLEILDEVKSKNGWTIVNIHSQYPTYSNEKFSLMIDEIRKRGIEIRHYEDAYDDFKNILEVRNGEDTKAGISATGKLHGFRGVQLLHPSEVSEDPTIHT